MLGHTFCLLSYLILLSPYVPYDTLVVLGILFDGLGIL